MTLLDYRQPNPSKTRLLLVSAALILAGGCGGDQAPGDGLPQQPPEAEVSCLETALPTGYCLVWRDEFRSDTLDADHWQRQQNCYGGGNNEAQCYVSDERNAFVDGEFLHIVAIPETRRGPAVDDDAEGYDPEDLSGDGSFTSARIRTKGLAQWQYGRFEVRAKLPRGQGSWPAAWMLPANNRYGGWALSGEIDIVEAVNLTVGGENRVHGTLHFGGAWPDNQYAGEAYQLPDGTNPADDFHVYALEWEAGEIRWYVDGDHYATQTSGGWFSAAALDQPHAPFDQAFYLILNLAVGGDWAGQVNDTGIDADAFPQELVVDYVRVYQCTADPDTGRGCASRDDDYTLNPGVLPPEPVANGDEPVVVFDDVTRAPFQWRSYAASGEVALRTASAGDSHGTVAEMRFSAEDGIGYFQADTSLDLSAFEAVVFDWRVVEDPRGGQADFFFRADCTWPCTSGPYALKSPELGQWQTTRVPLAELEQAGLRLDIVNTPFVLGPESGSHQGIVIQVDNIRLAPAI